ncbi:DUF3987 domain-containing protein [Ruegeria atlantica]|uniref:Primase C-terminal 2 domain-containing protein n=1 Tax=Ruegeria atlantica TaxID=81569 RepID=A0A0P1EFT0_9RHOB|nr:DUF3987 domain-containing protein [Ruegeria atlantica]CUH48952.1 hypothetical protein RUA4292_03143 [Ruegeria atlantica]
MAKDNPPTVTNATVWEQAGYEHNWLTFVVFSQGADNPKLGKFPTKPNAVRYPHSKEDAARYTYSEVQRFLSVPRSGDMVTCYDDPIVSITYGYLPRPDSLLTFADLDGCRDPVTGVIDQWAQDIISLEETYVEVSASGTGLRIVMTREPGDAEQSHVEANGCGFFANSRIAAALTFNALDGHNVQPTAAPSIKQAVLARRGHIAPGTERQSYEGDDDVPVELVKAMLEMLPNDAPPSGKSKHRGLSYDDWRDVGFAVCHSLGHEEGGPLFEAWSSKSKKFSAKEHAREWKGLKPDGRLTFGKLCYLVRNAHGGIYPPHVAAMMHSRTLQQRHAPLLPDAAASLSAALTVVAPVPAVPGVSHPMPTGVTVDQWGDTQPVDLMRPVLAPRLPEQCVPPVLRPLMSDDGPSMGVPPEIIFCACIGSVVAAMDDRMEIIPHAGSVWRESPRLWLAMIGDASVKKTPGLNLGMKPAKRIDRDNAETDGQSIARWQVELKRYNTALKRYTDGKDGAEQPEGFAPQHPNTDRLLVGDATVEKLGDILQHNPRGVTMLRDELSGWFASVEGRGGAATSRAAFLSLYNGGSYPVDRIGRGTLIIDSWSASIIGGIQPSALAVAMKYSPDDGLLQRFYPIFASRAPRATNTPTNPNNMHMFDAVVRKVHNSRNGTVELSPEAVAILDECWGTVHSLVAGGGLSGRLTSHLSKWEGGLFRWALVMHAIEAASYEHEPTAYPVTAQTARIVADLHTSYFLPSVFALYDDILGDGGDVEHVRWIAGYILSTQCETLALRDLQRNYRAWRAMDDTTKLRLMRYMEDSNWVSPTDANFLSRNWNVNPAVHTLFVDDAKREKERRAEIVAKIRS